MIKLAIDPGKDKCGLAVAKGKDIVEIREVMRADFADELTDLANEYSPEIVVLGDGTCSKEFQKEIESILPEIKIELIDEKYSSEEARKRYWDYNPPKGLKKLVPRGLLYPPEPYDKYVAVILLERYEKKIGSRF